MHRGLTAQIQLQFYLELPPEAHIHHIPQHFIGYRKKSSISPWILLLHVFICNCHLNVKTVNLKQINYTALGAFFKPNI